MSLQKIKYAHAHSEGGQTSRVVGTAGLKEIELEGGYYNQDDIHVFFSIGLELLPQRPCVIRRPMTRLTGLVTPGRYVDNSMHFLLGTQGPPSLYIHSTETVETIGDDTPCPVETELCVE